MRSCRVSLIVFFIFFTTALTLQAQEQRRISFNGFSGVALLPSSEKFNVAGQATNIFGGYGPAITGGLGLNYRFTHKYSLANNLFFFFSSKSNHDLQIGGLKSSLRYYVLKDTKKVSPFLSAGLNLNFAFLNRKQYSDSIFPNGSNAIGPGIGVTKIVYNYESLKLGFVPMPGASAGAGVNFKLSEKVNIFVEYSYNYNLAKVSNLIKDNYSFNTANLTYHLATAGITLKLLKPRKQLLATLNRDAWDGDLTVAVKGEIIYKKEKKSNEKIVQVLFTDVNDSLISIEPTDIKGTFEQKALRMGDYKYMLEKRNRNILRADLQVIHDNRKVSIFDDYPELKLEDFDTDNIISRDNNFSVMLREGFQHEVDVTVLGNSIFGKVTPVSYDTLCRNVLVLLKDINERTLAVTSPEKDCSFRFDNVEPGPHKIVFIRKPMTPDNIKFKYQFVDNPPLIRRQYNAEEDSVELYLNNIVEAPDYDFDINKLLIERKDEGKSDTVAIAATPKDPVRTKELPAKKVLVPLKEFQAGKTYSPEGEEKHPSGYGVQVGAFSSLANVKRMCDKLKKTRKEDVYIQVLSQDENNYNMKLYRIIVGDYPAIEMTDKKMESLKSAGYETVIRKHRDGSKRRDE